MNSMSKFAGVSVTLASAGLALILTSGVAGADGSESESVTHVPLRPSDSTSFATRDFPTNQFGLTYGSDAKISDPSEAPDLIAVQGVNGNVGFVRHEDQNFPGEPTKTEVVVYASDGITEIDTFRYEGVGANYFFDDQSMTREEALRRAASMIADEASR